MGASAMGWSPDGRYVFFQQGGVGLSRVSSDGREADGVGAGGRFPEVHPDGRRLVFSGKAQDDQGHFWVLENFLPKAAGN